jgi:hypothetical protein
MQPEVIRAHNAHMENAQRKHLGTASGLLSVLLSIAFGVVVSLPSQASHPVSPYILLVLLPGILILSCRCAFLATLLTSKWWLVWALINLVYTIMWCGFIWRSGPD